MGRIGSTSICQRSTARPRSRSRAATKSCAVCSAPRTEGNLTSSAVSATCASNPASMEFMMAVERSDPSMALSAYQFICRGGALPRPDRRSVRHHRIFAIEMPLQRIVPNVLSNAVAGALVANDMLMVASLPKMATRCFVRSVDGLRRHALVSADDGRQRLAMIAQFDNAVDVIWHDDEFVQRQCLMPFR